MTTDPKLFVLIDWTGDAPGFVPAIPDAPPVPLVDLARKFAARPEAILHALSPACRATVWQVARAGGSAAALAERLAGEARP